jgi:hypothetical protein
MHVRHRRSVARRRSWKMRGGRRALRLLLAGSLEGTLHLALSEWVARHTCTFLRMRSPPSPLHSLTHPPTHTTIQTHSVKSSIPHSTILSTNSTRSSPASDQLTPPSLTPARLPTTVPSLFDTILDLLVRHMEAVETLYGLPDSLKSRIAAACCARSALTPATLRLFTERGPTELALPNCTKLDAACLAEALEEVATSRWVVGSRVNFVLCMRRCGGECPCACIGERGDRSACRGVGGGVVEVLMVC